MKRIGHLFEYVVEPDNLKLAFWKASRGKRMRDDQRAFMRGLGDEITRLRDGLLAGNYPVGNFTRFKIHDPKEREICAASFGERVLQHALMNVCDAYFNKWLIADSYACRRGKGQVAAVSRARTFASGAVVATLQTLARRVARADVRKPPRLVHEVRCPEVFRLHPARPAQDGPP